MDVHNKHGERLDVVVEGNGDTTIIFVHGMGTDKNEGSTKLLSDISAVLQRNYRIMRFDLSGYGKSEGTSEEGNLHKWAEDLQAVLQSAKSFGGKNYILAHSMGMQVVTLLSPSHIEKTVFTGMPGFDSAKQIERLQRRMLSRGGTVDEQGISLYPRLSGDVQKIGKEYWAALRSFDTVEMLRTYARKTSLLAIRPLEDKIIKPEPFPTDIPARYIELPGDHNFMKREDRDTLIKHIAEFFRE
jgi:pimeloyl-ACP methyl ester carboxylesterase